MTNLLERAISTDDADRAAKIIQSALGIESDEVANYCFPNTSSKDREQRARIIGDWLRGSRYASPHAEVMAGRKFAPRSRGDGAGRNRTGHSQTLTTT
jgi:hypothetical protein